MAQITIIELDHIVLNVRGIDRSFKFYTYVLGLQGERVEEFRAGKVSFPSVRINDQTIIDLFPRKNDPAQPALEKASRNLNHFCLVVGPEDFSGIVDYLQGNQVVIREGPVSRWGAQGRATSVFFKQKTAYEIEIRCY